MTTWLVPFWVTLDRTDQTELRSNAGYFFSRLKVNTTSAALIGVPSLNLTPGRMVNDSMVSLPFQAHEVASQGVTLAFWSVLTNARGSYTCPIHDPFAKFARLDGVELQVDN